MERPPGLGQIPSETECKLSSSVNRKLYLVLLFFVIDLNIRVSYKINAINHKVV
jgi:hypothetical protein